ncbi:MAG: asparagine synthase (glutamine-hydrolyzing) [Candidatus Hodarchaeota archaeon]
MCGIIGEISNKIEIEKFIKMRDTLSHRGPDDEGLFINDSNQVALGHRRLSIIDLTKAGKQPMSNEDGTIWITYNGEIYNFKLIRRELIEKGHIFKSKTDTEVIIHGYEEWDVDILKKLNGMFAFGIWDDNKKRLFLARDRVGIKPLYYFYDEKRFIFASEIKAIVKDEKIKREIHPDAIKYYFTLGYIPNPLSIWKKIKKLPQGCYLIYNLEKKLEISNYWEIKLKNETDNIKNIIKKIEQYLEKSVEFRLISDVPIGVLLSGGIDSSLITALAYKKDSKLTSYSIGIETIIEKDLKYVDIFLESLPITNKKNILNSNNINDYLDKILFHYDEPFGISSIFPTFLLMETIYNEKKVIISGDGGDEVFAGYDWYKLYKKYYFLLPLFQMLNYVFNKFKNKIFQRVYDRFGYTIKIFSSKGLERYRMIRPYYFNYEELREILSDKILDQLENSNIDYKYGMDISNSIKKLQFFDFKTFLVDHILVKVDRASMAYSIELRVPFLDHNLIEYIFSLPDKIIYRRRKLKYLLKKLSKSLLPKEIIYRSKRGFDAPIEKLGFIQKNIHILKNSKLVNEGFIKKKYIRNVLNTPIHNLEPRIWLIILLELWYRKWKE